jgi:hypothetical protein
MSARTDLVALIIKSETEGLDTEDEVLDLAAGMVATGLVNSTGSNQRFVQSVIAHFGADAVAARI